MKQLLKKLNEPFPENNSFKEDFRYIIGVGIFVTLFLYLLRPFGIYHSPDDPFWMCAAFGVMTILMASIYELFCTYVLKLQKDIPSWTLWKWMLSAIFLILFIGVSNYLLIMYIMDWNSFSWRIFMHMLISTLAVGVFPITFSGMIIQMNAYKRNQIQAKNMQDTLPFFKPTNQQITLTGQTNQPPLNLPIQELYYLEAMQNYVSIYYWKEGQLAQILFRNTLSKMENQLKGTSVIRCHRSFLVNTNLIENVAGNAQGLRLTLKGLPDFEVPVSRKYIPTLKERIA